MDYVTTILVIPPDMYGWHIDTDEMCRVCGCRRVAHLDWETGTPVEDGCLHITKQRIAGMGRRAVDVVRDDEARMLIRACPLSARRVFNPLPRLRRPVPEGRLGGDVLVQSDLAYTPGELAFSAECDRIAAEIRAAGHAKRAQAMRRNIEQRRGGAA